MFDGRDTVEVMIKKRLTLPRVLACTIVGGTLVAFHAPRRAAASDATTAEASAPDATPADAGHGDARADALLLPGAPGEDGGGCSCFPVA
jgi:hypothetical protein